MAIIKLTKDLFENVSIVGRPHRTYVSSSSGVTGELTLSVRPSERIGEVQILQSANINGVLTANQQSLANALSFGQGGLNNSDGSVRSNLKEGPGTYKFDGTNEGTKNSQGTDLNDFSEVERQPILFKHIQRGKLRRIADTKKHYISASFFAPDIHSGQELAIAYNKNNVGVSLGPDRDSHILEEDITYDILIPKPSTNSNLQFVPADTTIRRNFSSNFNRQNVFRDAQGLRYVKDVLMHKYRTRYDNCNYAYSNFQCLNFLTASFTNSDAVLVYPNSAPSPGNQNLLASNQQLTASGGPYSVEKEMTIDFWINPKYDNVRPEWPFHAGTILHHSSSYVVSLVSGSTVDHKGLVDDFRIMVQLGSTAATLKPSEISLTPPLPAGVTLSKARGLKKNHWHRVTILVDTKGGSGNRDSKILIDGKPGGGFGGFDDVPNEISQLYADQTAGHHGQLGLFVGNFYDGKYDKVRNFFSANISDREGFFEADSITDHRYENKILSDDADADVGIGTVNLDHPLCAEIHDIKLYRKKLSDFEFSQIRKEGVKFEEGNPKKLAFYLPVLFNPRCRVRKTLTSPFTEDTDRPYTPTNSNFSLGVGGKLINLENYVKDYAQGNLPRLYHLTESLNSYINFGSSDDGISEYERMITNKFVYDIKGNSDNESFIANKGRTARNLMILPCDNGLATINYDCLNRDLLGHSLIRTNKTSDYSDSTNTNTLTVLDFSKPVNANIEKRMTNELGNLTINEVSLRNYLTKSFTRGDEIVPTKGDRMEFFPTSFLLENTDSRDVTLFSVPSIFYGERIHPGTLRISSDAVTGSQGRMKVTVKDNGKGMLYRADAKTPHATGSCVGNVFYDEGLVLYKSPHPLYFGKGGFTFDFKGEHTIHSLQINAPCPKELIFSSSNPSYLNLSASNSPHDEHNDFVYITDINVHDDNLNVIMKATLSQPVVKRTTDSFLFKLRQDF